MRRSKRMPVRAVFAVCMLLFLLGQNNMVAQCEESGSLRIILTSAEDAVPIRDAEFSLYQVAQYQNTGGVVSYHYTPEFAKCTVSEDSLGEADVASELLRYCTENGLSPVASKLTGSDGTCEFSSLPNGLYLAAQTNYIARYMQTDPFTVSLPTVISGVEYCPVEANPKVSVRHVMDITVKKLWNDDGTDRPSEIGAALKRQGNVVSTVSLSEANGWTYTWSGIEQADDWSVEEVNIPAGYRATYRREGNTFIIENTPALLQTGQIKWPVPILFLLGAVCLFVGLKLRREDDEA